MHLSCPHTKETPLRDGEIHTRNFETPSKIKSGAGVSRPKKFTNFQRILLFETMIKSCDRLTNIAIFYCIQSTNVEGFFPVTNRWISHFPPETNWQILRGFSCYKSTNFAFSPQTIDKFRDIFCKWLANFLVSSWDRLTKFKIFTCIWLNIPQSTDEFPDILPPPIDECAIFSHDQLANLAVFPPWPISKLRSFSPLDWWNSGFFFTNDGQISWFFSLKSSDQSEKNPEFLSEETIVLTPLILRDHSRT